MNTEQPYITGYNAGYLISKYEPALLSLLLKSLRQTNLYLQGFFSGKEQHQFEVLGAELDTISRIRGNSIHRETDLEKDL